MTTKEYLNELEKDVQKLRIREMLEESPTVRAALRNRREARSILLKRLRSLFGLDRQRATDERVEYR